MWNPLGQWVVVTGASAGIGAATAVEFAVAGANVALIARREEQLGEVRDVCRGHGVTAETFVADLSDLDGLDALVQRITAAVGPIDVLVNNAGVPKRRATSRLTAADAEEVMAMNYFSPVRLTLAVLGSMRERGAGHIVNVSSMGAHMVAFGVGAYSASKAALEMFTEALYVELAGSGVAAHLVVPGTTTSEFSTPKPGNDPPFPSDPATTAAPAVVAAAIVGCLSDERFVTYATERDAATAAAKRADPNGFLAAMKTRLAALDRG